MLEFSSESLFVSSFSDFVRVFLSVIKKNYR